MICCAFDSTIGGGANWLDLSSGATGVFSGFAAPPQAAAGGASPVSASPFRHARAIAQDASGASLLHQLQED
jgi:hypothetical protein